MENDDNGNSWGGGKDTMLFACIINSVTWLFFHSVTLLKTQQIWRQYFSLNMIRLQLVFDSHHIVAIGQATKTFVIWKIWLTENILLNMLISIPMFFNQRYAFWWYDMNFETICDEANMLQ